MSADKLDEELTVARLYINKMKSEVKNVVQRCSQLEVAQVDDAQKLEEMDKNLSDNRLLIQQVCHGGTAYTTGVPWGGGAEIAITGKCKY